MKTFITFFVLSFFVGLVYGNPLQVSKKPKTVDLKHSCISIKTEDNKGSPGKAPILLLHGLFMFKEIWMGLYQLLALRTGRRVCIADLRNHGDSPWADQSDISDMAEDLNPLLKKLGTDKVVLLGHSLGGKIAIHFALNYPEKIEKLIIEDMRPNGITADAMFLISGAMELLKEAITAIPKGVTEKCAKKAVMEYLKKALQLFNIHFDIDHRAAEYFPIRCVKNKCEWKTNLKLVEKYVDEPHLHLTNSTGLCEKPALFIYGKKSPFKIFDAKEEILKLFPNAELVGVEGAAHTVNKFPEYKDSVIKFINKED